MKIKSTKSRPFDILVPATENRPARKVATITVESRVDNDGDEILTPESLALIDKTQARYMGLLIGEDILALRERLGLSQEQLSDLLGCGKKSLSRWENGHGYPSQLVNTILRALQEGLLTIAQLRSLQEPAPDWAEIIYSSRLRFFSFRCERNTGQDWTGCPAFKRGNINNLYVGS